jgi:transposase-like protein
MIRWADTNGTPVCPSCGSVEAYEARRPNGALRFRCKGCKKDFSITSGTLFASHKLPLRGYLAAIAVFCNEVKGKSALALSRDLGLSYKSAFVLLHKLREAMAEELKGRVVGGEGKKLKWMADILGDTSSQPTSRKIALTAALPVTRMASAR